MCLQVVEDVFTEPATFGIGYKFFLLGPSGELQSPSWVSGHMLMKEGEWLIDEKRATLSSSWTGKEEADYPSGFHLFVNKEDALKNMNYFNDSSTEDHQFTLRRVRYQEVLAMGTNLTTYKDEKEQYGLCLVVRKLFIEAEGKE